MHLGYRKGLNGGKWVLRRYLGKETYHVETIAIADDHSVANGVEILDFFQAQRKARERAALAKAPVSPCGPFTVAAALDAYFERLKHEGSKSLADARGRTKLHILPKLGTIAVADLTRDLLTKWLTGLAGGPEGGTRRAALSGHLSRG